MFCCVVLSCVLFCFCFELQQLAYNTKLFHAAKQNNNMQGFFFLTKLVEQEWVGVDHVGTMEQWEERKGKDGN
jgi:hypothetical protein